MSFDNNMLTVEHLTETISITKVGVFIWNLETDHVIYSKEWAEIVGYELEELTPHVSTWESMLFPSDLQIAEDNLNKYLSGEVALYEAEFRLVKKDGSIIWGHDKGKVTKYTEDGKPLILCGVLQDITNIKITEQLLRESTNILNLAIEVAEFGTWDWDLEKDIIAYNDEYLSMLGYTQDEINGSLSEWENMNHPEDLVVVSKMLDEFVDGRRETYECEIRMRHKDGHYIWTKDVGKIVSRDENGIATRVIGGHLNIDSLKTSQFQLKKTLNELENHQIHLEKEIELRTKTLIEQDQLLIAVNNVSQKLLAVEENSNFDEVLTDCLESLTHAFNTSEFSLWRYLKINDNEFFYMSHFYNKDYNTKQIFDIKNMKDYIVSLLNENSDFEVHVTKDSNLIINYSILSKDLRNKFENERTVRDFATKLRKQWRASMNIDIEDINSDIISSIYLYNELFGFIATGTYSANTNYSEAHESMLDISGKLFANAQNKHEMDEKLRSAHEEALLSSQAKSNFLANMSHEIRTPLNAILGMSEIVLRESKGRNTEEYAAEIKRASESLLVIINDILDISKIESGKLSIIDVEYNIASLLNDVINLSKMRLEDKPVILTSFIQSDIPNTLFGDEIRIKQVLINLISNAIKFTKQGNINIDVKYEMQNDNVELIFEVSDTGMGIRQDEMHRLFMQFERVDTKKNRNIEGTGLGLAITKQLCEMMDGSVSVHSELEVGSVFTVRIPQKFVELTPITYKFSNTKILLYEARELYAKSIKQTIDDLGANCTICTNQSELSQSLAEEVFDYLFTPVVHVDKIKNLCAKRNASANIVLMTDPGDLTIYADENAVNLPISCIQMAQILGNSGLNMRKKKKISAFIAPTANILVVDDNKTNLKVAIGLLAPYKINIDTAINGLLAVEMIKKNKYDLVFMDHMMPVMDGIDATNEIRKMEDVYFKDLPIVALTANAIVGAKELFVNEGMNDFLAKPIEVKKLNGILQKWLPEDKKETAIEQVKNVETVETVEITIDGVNTSYGINMIGGKLDDYYDVLNTFYYDGLNRIENLRKANENQDLDEYRIEIHALKSAAGSIGAFNVSNEAKTLEEAAMKRERSYISVHTEAFINLFNKLLSSIEVHVTVNAKDSSEKLENGNIVLLENSINEIEIALTTFDIDVLEQTIHECMTYVWKGQINEMLINLKQLIDSFEYYNARPIVEDLKKEMVLYYDLNS